MPASHGPSSPGVFRGTANPSIGCFASITALASSRSKRHSLFLDERLISRSAKRLSSLLSLPPPFGLCHYVDIVGVTGSIPVPPTIFSKYCHSCVRAVCCAPLQRSEKSATFRDHALARR